MLNWMRYLTRTLKKLNNAPIGVLITIIVYLCLVPVSKKEELISDTLVKVSDPIELESTPADEILAQSIRISINGDSFELGLKRDEEVYLPWTWIKPYFDVYGLFNKNENLFEFSNANSKISYDGNKTYTSKSAFLNFGSYTVENRDRVKVIDGTHGVPISTQWSIDGYFYAIQIAQYALVAYTKNATDSQPQRVKNVLLNKNAKNCDWLEETLSFDSSKSENDETTCILHVNEPKLFKLQITGELSRGSILTFHLDIKDINSGRQRKFKIAYVADQVPDSTPRISFDKENNFITIGLGIRDELSTFTRDLSNDIIKGIGWRQTKSVKKHNLRLRNIEKIVMEGKGKISQLTLANSRYETNFYDAANWLYTNQNSEGKWPIFVEKELDDYPTLKPGWCSAMAQGHGLSVMVRAAQVTGQTRFWEAAHLALGPFKKDTTEGGVRNRFLNKYVWYEEYPFTEGLYVLNGFMYSLIGLYDLLSADDAPSNIKFEAKELFDQGLESLKIMLPLYDNGKGSNYDLQHFIKSKAPNRARWDYHTVHIQQLNVFKSVRHEEIFAKFASRWLGYLNGHYSDHN